jgi:signal transduction histidine kinase
LSFVESYRRFTGIPKPDLRPVELAPFVENALRLEEPLLRERGIAVSARFADRAIVVDADEGQIGQVLVNLLKNAAEAIPPEQTDGRIEVSVSREGDESVSLSVSNNGAPVPSEVLPHIFVPFFTTKPTGTGIGLSVSRYIMRLHGGNLKHHVEGGRTVFSMMFSAI